MCHAEIKAARELAAANSDVRVFLINVDRVIESDPLLFADLIDLFDLSALPYIIQTDKNGCIVRCYMTLQ